MCLCVLLLSGCATNIDYKIKTKEFNQESVTEISKVAIIQKLISKETVSGNGNIGSYNRKMKSISSDIVKELSARNIDAIYLEGEAKKSYKDLINDVKGQYPHVFIINFKDAHITVGPNYAYSSAHMTVNISIIDLLKKQTILKFEATDPMQAFHSTKKTAIAIIGELEAKGLLKINGDVEQKKRNQ